MVYYRAHNVNTLLDLRGCTFAYSDEKSLSGSKIVLKTLKEKGENASFFGSLLSTYFYLFYNPPPLANRRVSYSFNVCIYLSDCGIVAPKGLTEPIL